jgi:hypothetical protein
VELPLAYKVFHQDEEYSKYLHINRFEADTELIFSERFKIRDFRRLDFFLHQ